LIKSWIERDDTGKADETRYLVLKLKMLHDSNIYMLKEEFLSKRAG
jgi:hypothetical protein